jgi:hypothetical protein
MALRAVEGDEAALGRRGARAHACRLDTRVEAWLPPPQEPPLQGSGRGQLPYSLDPGAPPGSALSGELEASPR